VGTESDLKQQTHREAFGASLIFKTKVSSSWMLQEKGKERGAFTQPLEGGVESNTVLTLGFMDEIRKLQETKVWRGLQDKLLNGECEDDPHSVGGEGQKQTGGLGTGQGLCVMMGRGRWGFSNRD